MIENFKRKFIGDRNFYSKVLRLAIPMIVQNAITSFVSFLDNIMVGQTGTEQMSGVAIVNQLMFVFNICIFGGVSGAGIFGTQFFGKGDHEGHKYTFRFKIYTVFVISGIALALFGFMGPELISLYLSDSGEMGDITLALKYGLQYLSIMMISLIPFAVTQAYVSSVRETGQTFVPMLASIIAVAINLVLDYLLIFGRLGLPAMGVRGAALATVIARVIETIIVIAWTHIKSAKNRFIIGAYRGLRIPKSICIGIFKKGLPLMLNEMLWASGMAVIAQCYAVRGLHVVAAQNISSTISNLFNIVYIQLGACISVIVGQQLGAGRLKEAKDSANKMIVFGVFCCTIVSLIMIAVGKFFPEIYNTERAIKNLATTFIIISAAVMPVCAFSHCAYFTLRSGGKTIITFLFDSAYTWVVVIPVAYVLANFSKLSIEMVFFLVSFMEIFKATIGFFMVRSGVWVQNIIGNTDGEG